MKKKVVNKSSLESEFMEYKKIVDEINKIVTDIQRAISDKTLDKKKVKKSTKTKKSDYASNKKYYYHLRGYNNRPLITICLLKQGDEYARGISFCSLKDMPYKMVGRGISFDRAVHALTERKTEYPIGSENVFKIVEKLKNVDEFEGFRYKEEYMPKLSSFERKLVGIDRRE